MRNFYIYPMSWVKDARAIKFAYDTNRKEYTTLRPDIPKLF